MFQAGARTRTVIVSVGIALVDAFVAKTDAGVAVGVGTFEMEFAVSIKNAAAYWLSVPGGMDTGGGEGVMMELSLSQPSWIIRVEGIVMMRVIERGRFRLDRSDGRLAITVYSCKDGNE